MINGFHHLSLYRVPAGTANVLYIGSIAFIQVPIDQTEIEHFEAGRLASEDRDVTRFFSRRHQYRENTVGAPRYYWELWREFTWDGTQWQLYAVGRWERSYV